MSPRGRVPGSFPCQSVTPLPALCSTALGAGQLPSPARPSSGPSLGPCVVHTVRRKPPPASGAETGRWPPALPALFVHSGMSRGHVCICVDGRQMRIRDP